MVVHHYGSAGFEVICQLDPTLGELVGSGFVPLLLEHFTSVSI